MDCTTSQIWEIEFSRGIVDHPATLSQLVDITFRFAYVLPLHGPKRREKLLTIKLLTVDFDLSLRLDLPLRPTCMIAIRSVVVSTVFCLTNFFRCVFTNCDAKKYLETLELDLLEIFELLKN